MLLLLLQAVLITFTSDLWLLPKTQQQQQRQQQLTIVMWILCACAFPRLIFLGYGGNHQPKCILHTHRQLDISLHFRTSKGIFRLSYREKEEGSWATGGFKLCSAGVGSAAFSVAASVEITGKLLPCNAGNNNNTFTHTLCYASCCPFCFMAC